MEAPTLQHLVHEWYDTLFRFAFSLCADREDALDLTQNAFHKYATKAGQLRDPGKAKSWLFSTLHREFIDQYRRNRRFPSTPLENVVEGVSREDETPGENLDAQAVLAALKQLEERFKAPLTLFYLESFSYREIADILDIPIGTVMSRLRRAKDQLRALMEEERSEYRHPIDFQKETRHG